ncbi:MAG: hypothetical protein EOO78_26065, partial [Oxalobacteraceae bacterium]
VVLQMTSTVTATRHEGMSTAQVLAALFPCGSVTGAPKRCTWNSAGTRTEPVSATRPRSLRSRSTIIRFSARVLGSCRMCAATSVSRKSSPLAAAVPFIGCAVSVRPSCRMNSSGDRESSAPPSGSSANAPYGTGWRARSRRYSAAGVPQASK